MSKTKLIKHWISEYKRKLKFWVIAWIDFLDPNSCWNGLCYWAGDLPSEDISILPWSENYPTVGSCDNVQGDYCGKCILTGTLEKPYKDIVLKGDQYLACMRSKNTGKHYLKSLFYIKFKRLFNRVGSLWF